MRTSPQQKDGNRNTDLLLRTDVPKIELELDRIILKGFLVLLSFSFAFNKLLSLRAFQDFKPLVNQDMSIKVTQQQVMFQHHLLKFISQPIP